MLIETSCERLEQKIRELELENASLREDLSTLETTLAEVKAFLPDDCDKRGKPFQLSLADSRDNIHHGASAGIPGTSSDTKEHNKILTWNKGCDALTGDIISSLPGVVFQLIQNTAGEIKISFVSQGAVRLFDMPIKEIFRPKNIIEIIPQEDRERIKVQMAEAVATMSDSVIECRIRLKDSRLKWIKGVVKPIFSNNGRILWSGFIAEVTSWEKNSNSIEFQAMVLNNIQDLVRITDLDGNTIYVNDAECRKINRTRRQILTPSFDEFRKKHTYKFSQKEIIENTVKHGAWQGEIDTLFPDGDLVPLFVRTNLIRDKEGNPWRIASVASDMTEQKKSEKERNMLLAAIEQLPDTVFITDAECTIEYVNAAFERQSGYSRDECIGRDAKILRSGEHNTQFFINLWGTISAGRIWTGKMINKRKDGVFYTVDAIISPVRDSKGEIINYVFVQRDISNEIEMGEKIAQAQKIESIGTLAGGIAHDFNNMLFPILGHAEILLQEIPAHDLLVRDSLQQIYESAVRAKDLVQQILTFSRRKKEVRSPLLIQTAIEDVLKLMSSSIPRYITVETEVDQNTPQVYADPIQMHQVIMNLITNSVQAMPRDSGTIKLSLMPVRVSQSGTTIRIKPGKYACLMVSDTGSGMPRDVMKKIFEPFFTTKGEDMGTGMGLSVVYGIIKDMGGGIKVHSRPGKGSEFHIYLPAYQGEATDSQSVDMIPSCQEVLQTRIHALYVDDEPPILKIAGAILDRLGCHVTTMDSPLEALDCFKKDPFKFDLVITDMYMEQMNGNRLCEKLLAIRSDIPVFLCTGFSEDITCDMMAASGIKGVLSKPLIIKEFSDTIDKILDDRQNVKT